MLAFAKGVPDIAPHDEIARDRAGEAADIVGRAGDETRGKALGEMRRGVFFRDRIRHAMRHLVGQRDLLLVRQLHETVRQIGVAARQRLLDALCDYCLIIP